MIYTSYYANVKNIDREKYYTAQISNSAPFSLDFKIDLFIPDWKNIVQPHKLMEITDEEFKERYINQLKLNKDKIEELVKELQNKDKPTVLICYEKPDKFCHRFILAEFINSLVGKNIVEEL